MAEGPSPWFHSGANLVVLTVKNEHGDWQECIYAARQVGMLKNGECWVASPEGWRLVKLPSQP